MPRKEIVMANFKPATINNATVILPDVIDAEPTYKLYEGMPEVCDIVLLEAKGGLFPDRSFP